MPREVKKPPTKIWSRSMKMQASSCHDQTEMTHEYRVYLSSSPQQEAGLTTRLTTDRECCAFLKVGRKSAAVARPLKVTSCYHLVVTHQCTVSQKPSGLPYRCLYRSRTLSFLYLLQASARAAFRSSAVLAGGCCRQAFCKFFLSDRQRSAKAAVWT